MVLPIKTEVSPEETDKESGLQEVEKVIFFPMHPMHSIHMQEGVDEGLKSFLLKYYPRVHGVPISCKTLDIRPVGTVLPSGMIQVAIRVKFQVFAAQTDQVLVGVVQKLFKGHLGCLVHRLFNAYVVKEKPGDDFGGVQSGDFVRFRVSTVHLGRRIPFVKGVFLGVLRRGVKVEEGEESRYEPEVPEPTDRDVTIPLDGEERGEDSDRYSDSGIESEALSAVGNRDGACTDEAGDVGVKREEEDETQADVEQRKKRRRKEIAWSGRSSLGFPSECWGTTGGGEEVSEGSAWLPLEDSVQWDSGKKRKAKGRCDRFWEEETASSEPHPAFETPEIHQKSQKKKKKKKEREERLKSFQDEEGNRWQDEEQAFESQCTPARSHKKKKTKHSGSDVKPKYEVVDESVLLESVSSSKKKRKKTKRETISEDESDHKPQQQIDLSESFLLTERVKEESARKKKQKTTRKSWETPHRPGTSRMEAEATSHEKKKRKTEEEFGPEKHEARWEKNPPAATPKAKEELEERGDETPPRRTPPKAWSEAKPKKEKEERTRKRKTMGGSWDDGDPKRVKLEALPEVVPDLFRRHLQSFLGRVKRE